MRIFSLFAGIGGFEFGLQGWGECVGYSEIDKWATGIHDYHWPGVPNFSDATTINPDDLPEFDLLCAGFPCQSFSIAGRREGFRDVRGTLFFEIARIAGAARPDYLLLENVKGLLGHDGGDTFAQILETLSNVGYDLQWQCLNSKDFGVPQNRERVFIIGHSRTVARPQVFPLGSDGAVAPQKSKEVRVGCLSDRQGRMRNRELILHTNKANMVTPHEEAQALRSGASHNYQTVANCIRPVANRSAMNYGLRQGDSIRRLTPLECERLQGFPDGWTRWALIDGKKVEVSDTQRYKCLGNAVTVNVVAAICLPLSSPRHGLERR